VTRMFTFGAVSWNLIALIFTLVNYSIAGYSSCGQYIPSCCTPSICGTCYVGCPTGSLCCACPGVAQSCSIGTYQEQSGQEKCKSCENAAQQCGAGLYLRDCGGCSQGICVSCASSSCGGGSYLKGCSGVSPGFCASCPSCPEGSYSSECGGRSPGQCVVCGPGTYASGLSCIPCEEGFYCVNGLKFSCS